MSRSMSESLPSLYGVTNLSLTTPSQNYSVNLNRVCAALIFSLVIDISSTQVFVNGNLVIGDSASLLLRPSNDSATIFISGPTFISLALWVVLP